MNFITDYQLDIDKGFMCKVNGIAYQFDFTYSTQQHLYYISNILKLADFLEIDRAELKGIFNNKTAYDVIYCGSKQECYDLCQHIVGIYFQPTNIAKETKELCEKSRRHLAKYYNPAKNIVIFPYKNFYLYKWNNEGHWFWRNTSIGSSTLYEQFKLTKDQVLVICSNLNLLAYFAGNVLVFENATDAIKFTDYLIETYIIKKEKTYDTNQLRKERTAIRRGAKPAGNCIHGRRGKASVRCRYLKHKARIGY